MTRMRSSSYVLTSLFSLLVGCTGPSDATKSTWEPQQERIHVQRNKDNAETLARQQAYEKALLDLDHLMDKYVQAVWSLGNDRADRQALTLEKAIRDIVLDHFAELMRSAIEPDQGQNRAIAIASLGFSQRPEAIDPLLNGLTANSPQIAGNAAFALGILRDPRTPVAGLTALVMTERGTDELIERPKDEMRRTASWTLLRLQPALNDRNALAKVWPKILATPVEKLDAGVAVHALRGIGLLRDKDLSGIALPYASHPMPKVREAAAIALGMLGNPSAVETLLALLGTAEANQNVRLAARKALMALAGNVDLGFDVAEWRKVFQRGI